MKKLSLALLGLVLCFAPLSAQAMTEAEVAAIPCSDMMGANNEQVFVGIFEWLAENAGFTEEAEFVAVGQYVVGYCTSNPGATFGAALEAFE